MAFALCDFLYTEICVPLNGWSAVADGYRTLGICFNRLSQYDSAMVYYDKALEAVVRMRDFPQIYNESDIDNNLSSIYGSMGNLYNIQGKYHEAIEYYQKALSIFEKYDWKESQTIAYNNIGEMYMSMNNYEQAEINFIKLDSLAHITGVSLHIVYAKKQFGHLYLTTKDYEKALQNIEIAYDYYFSHPEEEGENRAVILLDDSMKELRRLAHHLMPESLVRCGLKTSLEVFCRSMPNTCFHYFGDDARIDEKLEILLYRSAHELIYNVLKHARATETNVQLIQETDRISLTVHDNGSGFDAAQPTGGMGLHNIRSRVVVFNGTFNITSAPGKGTEINMEFQLKNG